MKNPILLETYNKINNLLAKIDNSSFSLIALMREARTVSILLNDTDFTQWIDKEVHGYNADETIPSYRYVTGHVTAGEEEYIPLSIKTYHKSTFRLNEIISYPYFSSISQIESSLSVGMAWYKGETITTINGIKVFKKTTILSDSLKQVINNIKDELIKKLHTHLKILIEEGDAMGEKESALNTLIDILYRFNDYRSEILDNEAQLNREIFKVIKPTFPDAIEEEHLTRSGIKNPRADFAIQSIKVLIEDKYVKKVEDMPKVQEQLLADISQYFTDMHEYESLVIFIYSSVHVPSDFIKSLKRSSKVIEVIVCYAVPL